MLRSFYSVVLIVCLASQAIAAGPTPRGSTAIVTGGSTTTVGDVQVETTMAAFPNDVVETHSDQFSKLTLKGNSLALLGKSKIQLLPNAAKLLGGGIVVSTNTNYEVRTECFSVVPVSRASKFSVTPYQGRTYVYAEQGDALIKRTKPGQPEVRIPQGKTLTITNACKAGELMQFARESDNAYKIAMGAAAAGGAIAVCTLSQDMSPDKRKRTCSK